MGETQALFRVYKGFAYLGKPRVQGCNSFKLTRVPNIALFFKCPFVRFHVSSWGGYEFPSELNEQVPLNYTFWTLVHLQATEGILFP